MPAAAGEVIVRQVASEGGDPRFTDAATGRAFRTSRDRQRNRRYILRVFTFTMVSVLLFTPRLGWAWAIGG